MSEREPDQVREVLRETWQIVRPFLAEANRVDVSERLRLMLLGHGISLDLESVDELIAEDTVAVIVDGKRRRVRVKGPGPGGHLMVEGVDQMYFGIVKVSQVVPADREKVVQFTNPANFSFRPDSEAPTPPST